MKRLGKRIMAGALAAAMMMTLLPVITGGNPYKWAEASWQSEMLKSDGIIMRGVVKELGDIPHDPNAELGTFGYPFVVLEIVPSLEYAEFGYLIDGCEPVRIHDLLVDGDKVMIEDILYNLGSADITPTTAYFFEDEDEEEYETYSAIGQENTDRGIKVLGGNDKVYGYFEKVNPGEGNWELVEAEPANILQQDDLKKVGDEKKAEDEEVPNTEDEDNQGEGETPSEPEEGETPTEPGEGEIPSEPDEGGIPTEPSEGGSPAEGTTPSDESLEISSAKEARFVLMVSTDITDNAYDDPNTDGLGGEIGDSSQPDDNNPGSGTPAEGETPSEGGTPAEGEIPTEDAGNTSDKTNTDEPVVELLNVEVYEGATCWFEKNDNGSWIWHSYNELEKESVRESLEAEGIEWNDYFENPGDLKGSSDDYNEAGYVYAVRTPSGDCIEVNPYYIYENKELFLTESLGLSKEDAENYSIVVKTITPKELNAAQEWIDRANLIYLSSASHGENLSKAWIQLPTTDQIKSATEPTVPTEDSMDSTTDQEEESAESATDESADEEAKDPTTDEPADQPTKDPTTDESTDQPTKGSTTDEPIDEPAKKPDTDEPAMESEAEFRMMVQPINQTDQPTTSDIEGESTEKPSADQPTTDEPTDEETDHPTNEPTDYPTTDEPTEEPTTDRPTTNEPSADHPTIEEPTTEESTIEELVSKTTDSLIGQTPSTNEHSDADLAYLWSAYGWLNESISTIDTFAVSPANPPRYTGGNDLSWDTAVKLYRKAANELQGSIWEQDYAAFIMDDNIYDPSAGLFENTTGTVSIDIYDWNLKKTSDKYPSSGTITGSNNNVYKLGIMLMAMDTSLFTNLYLNPINGNQTAAVQAVGGVGTNTLQSNNARTYWTVQTFFLEPPPSYMSADYANYDAYWTNELWQNYHSAKDLMDKNQNAKYKYWVNDHAFTVPGDKGILTGYGDNYEDYVKDNFAKHKELFPEFYEYYNTPSTGNTQPGTETGIPRPADAVNYILRGILSVRKPAGEASEEPVISVLDLEPSVELDTAIADSNKARNANQKQIPYKWLLTESYVQMLLDGTDHKIEITHQTTAEFISKTEDLASKYQMIYVGLDVGGYYTGSSSVTVSKGKRGSASLNLTLPQWNDTSLGKKIYTHSGDWVLYRGAASGYGTMEKPNWIWTGSRPADSAGDVAVNTNEYLSSSTSNGWYVRFPGNDISHRKMLDLERFLAAGHPVVAERYLYNLEDNLIDKDSFIYQFVGSYAKKGRMWSAATRPDFACSFCSNATNHLGAGSTETWSKVYSPADAADISVDVNEAFDSLEKVNFEELPKLYNYHGKDGNLVYQYLDIEGSSAKMAFRWKIDDDNNDWTYRIFIDMDGDSKFEDDEDYTEIINEGKAYSHLRENGLYCLISADVPGPVQWKIEVYRESNPNIKYMRTGCSAVLANSGGTEDKSKRTEINVLQIRPSDKGNPANENGAGFLNMATDTGFQNLFGDLKDYKVNLDSIIYEDYEAYFVGNKFVYDVSSVTYNSTWKPGGPSNKKSLLSYDVIIVGFEDSSGINDITDENGAVQFLWYWADAGRGILFTHDLTSMYIATDILNATYIGSNGRSTAWTERYGTSMSNMMRDVMGMNRYGVISAYARQNRVRMMYDYQEKQKTNDSDGVHYDWMKAPGGSMNTKTGRHGLTYYAMCFFSAYTHLRLDTQATSHLLYKSVPIVPNTNSSTNAYPNNVGISVAAWTAEWTSQVNEGQVTTYPYEIPKMLKVAPTHTQYFSMNPEDEDVIVWYALAENQNTGWYSYDASPNDGLNNYYIYSKNNIFYSGVGHNTVTGDDEKRLLVNVVIAAYKAGHTAMSFVEIKDVEEIAAKGGVVKAYQDSLTQNYADWFLEGDEQYLYKLNRADIQGEYHEIMFKPRDSDPYMKNLECVIVYEYTDKGGVTHRVNITEAAGNLGVFNVNNGTASDTRPTLVLPGTRIELADVSEDSRVLKLDNYKDYCLRINKSDMFWRNLNGTDVDVESSRIIFYLRNDASLKMWSQTTLDLSILPLFLLE